MKIVWIVEEVSSHSGKTIFKEHFQNYDEAHETYNQRKRHDEHNFVSLYKTTVGSKRE